MQQQHRRRRRRPRPRQQQHEKTRLFLSAFVSMPPPRRTNDASTRIAEDRITPRPIAATGTSSLREHPNSHRNPGFLSTTALAASKSKNKKSAKKKKTRGGTAGSGGSGGFGVSSSTDAPPAPASAPSQPRTINDARTAVSSSRATPAAAAAASSAPGGGGQLPDDDFATFPPLSPDTLKSVMGVDVFDLPPGGIPASERGQQQALPSQVLGCIRERHGLQEFGGGRRLLDPEYDDDQDSTEMAADAGSGDGSGSSSSKGLLFPGLRLLHAEPPVIGVDDFFTPEECDQYVSRSLSPSPSSPPPPSSQASSSSSSSSGVDVDGGNGPHKQRSATLGADVDAVAQVKSRVCCAGLRVPYIYMYVS